MRKQTKLVGLGRVAGSAVSSEMVLPCLDVVLGLTAHAVEPLVKVLTRPPSRLVTIKRMSVPSGPASTLGDPGEIARAVRFFVESGFATGAILTVDGGRLIA